MFAFMIGSIIVCLGVLTIIVLWLADDYEMTAFGASMIALGIVLAASGLWILPAIGAVIAFGIMTYLVPNFMGGLAQLLMLVDPASSRHPQF